MQRPNSATIPRVFLALVTAATLVGATGATVLADSSASTLPPNWHIHDGQSQLGSQHKGIGFFPTILAIATSQYLQDPARCPNATDKAFLPSNGSRASTVLRAGVCFTTTDVIHLRTVPLGTSGPAGWGSLIGTDGGRYVTYYFITSR
jgi:hypothetical protein